MKLRSNLVGFLIGLIICAPIVNASIQLSSSGGGVTVGTTPITGGVANAILYGNASGIVSSSANLTFNDVGAGNGTLQLIKTPATAGGTFFQINGTMPVTMSGQSQGVVIDVIGGSVNNQQAGTYVRYTPTGNAGNNVTDIALMGVYNAISAAMPTGGGVAIYGSARNQSISSKRLIGVQGYATLVSGSGTAAAAGVVGSTDNGGGSGAGLLNLGVYGIAGNTVPTNQIGGLFALAGSAAWYSTTGVAALIADNGTTTGSIFIGRDNATTVFQIADGGAVSVGGSTAPAGNVNAKWCAKTGTDRNICVINSGGTINQLAGFNDAGTAGVAMAIRGNPLSIVTGTQTVATFADDTVSSSALTLNNGVNTGQILIAQDNGVPVLSIPDNGGLRLFTAIARPACDSTRNGLLYYVAGGAGVADTYTVCLKNSSDAYNWADVAVPVP